MKKFNFNWQGVILGMVLCAVLVVSIGSKPADPQVTTTQSQVLHRVATVADVYEKTADLETRIVAMEERLVRIEQKIDTLSRDVDMVLRVTKKVLKEEVKN